ncbi:MAG: DMT family transporter [Patescibacteria group bacterium]
MSSREVKINLKKGIFFSFATALISGVAIFLNAAYVSKIIKDIFLLTSVRNIIVAIFLSALVLGISKWVSLKKLTLKQWGLLFVIGLIGGSIPFLLFFKGLSISSSAALNGAFIHKTLFLWVAVLAIIFLKERLSFWQIGALGVLLAGIYLAGGPKNWVIGQGEKLVFLAVFFWAIEFIIAKAALKKLPSMIVAWGRMFFGSLILVGFLAYTHRWSNIQHLNLVQWWWLIGTGILLFGYVTTWYTGLKHAPASVVTSILTLGFPVTVILNSIFVTHRLDYKQLIGVILICLAVFVFSKIRLPRKDLKLQYVRV